MIKTSKRFNDFWNRVRCNLYAAKPQWAVRVAMKVMNYES